MTFSKLNNFGLFRLVQSNGDECICVSNYFHKCSCTSNDLIRQVDILRPERKSQLTARVERMPLEAKETQIAENAKGRDALLVNATEGFFGE